MSFSLIQPLFSVPIACIDVETTGASARWGDRIIEIGIVRYENGQKAAEYQQLIDPCRPISPGVTALTGISQEMCAGQPTFADQLPAMLPLLNGAAVLGHNIGFDLSFLASEFRRVGREMSQDLGDPHVLDTLRIARRRFGRGGNGLETLSRRLGYEPPIAHRALPDAVTTIAVFELLLATVGGWNISLCDVLHHQGGPVRIPPSSARSDLLPVELEEALDHRKPVMLEYLDANQLRTRRIVDPIQIRRHGGELVLTAYCHLRNDRRHFKLQRIVRLSSVQAESPSPTNLVPDGVSS